VHRPVSCNRVLPWIVGAGLVALIVAAYFLIPWMRTRGVRMLRLRDWFNDPQAHPEWRVQGGQRCGEAPFLLPSDGYIGCTWGDSFSPGHAHQGIDIFGGQAPGLTPVVAAYRGYLTRLPEWKSSLIIRIPSDPLAPGRQIWTYYTHMADINGSSYISPQFPPGTREQFVEAGAFLGYQGNYSGDPHNPTGIHLHFSIVLDDGQGSFSNELKISYTLDPSRYLGLPLNASTDSGVLAVCGQ
jgi:murein DD-endopeptidase MepM/ murein hydrolase activator NlpD